MLFLMFFCLLLLIIWSFKKLKNHWSSMEGKLANLEILEGVGGLLNLQEWEIS